MNLKKKMKTKNIAELISFISFNSIKNNYQFASLSPVTTTTLTSEFNTI